MPVVVWELRVLWFFFVSKHNHCFSLGVAGLTLFSCLSVAISAFAVAALVLPGNYPYYLDLISSLSIGPFLIGMAKLGIAFPTSYHTYNGIRHLVRQILSSLHKSWPSLGPFLL